MLQVATLACRNDVHQASSACTCLYAAAKEGDQGKAALPYRFIFYLHQAGAQQPPAASISSPSSADTPDGLQKVSLILPPPARRDFAQPDQLPAATQASISKLLSACGLQRCSSETALILEYMHDGMHSQCLVFCPLFRYLQPMHKLACATQPSADRLHLLNLASLAHDTLHALQHTNQSFRSFPVLRQTSMLHAVMWWGMCSRRQAVSASGCLCQQQQSSAGSGSQLRPTPSNSLA